MKSNSSFFWKFLKGLLKFSWKLSLAIIWGFLRITELIMGALAKWTKSINS